MFDLATSHLDGYKGHDGDDLDTYEQVESLQADDESAQNLEA
jgi:hypothetical protein